MVVICRYLASLHPKYKGGTDAACAEVCKPIFILLETDMPASSATAHTHGVAVHGGNDPLDHSIWLSVDRPLMDTAWDPIACMMARSDRSFRDEHEIEMCKLAAQPIVYMGFEVFPAEFAT